VALDALGREPHVVADADRLVGEQVNAGEEVRSVFLQRQRDGEAATPSAVRMGVTAMPKTSRARHGGRRC